MREKDIIVHCDYFWPASIRSDLQQFHPRDLSDVARFAKIGNTHNAQTSQIGSQLNTRKFPGNPNLLFTTVIRTRWFGDFASGRDDPRFPRLLPRLIRSAFQHPPASPHPRSPSSRWLLFAQNAPRTRTSI